MSGENWTTVEVDLIVSDYFDMLFKQLNHIHVNKTEHRNRLLNIISRRSKGSIEFKHQNISAVLVQLGIPYLSGYRPRFNYQELLFHKVAEKINNLKELNDTIDKYLDSPSQTQITHFSHLVEVPKPKFEIIQTYSVKTLNPKTEIDYYKRESENRKLGLQGEELIVQFEKNKLRQLKRTDLIPKVEHTSQTSGDSAGFDIRSFDQDGNELHIEVKTTNLDQYAPFYLTSNELYHSIQNFEKYSLYRVFNFKSQPKFYQLPGSLEETCTLTPKTFIGTPV